MKKVILHNMPITGQKVIEERAISLAEYIIDSKDTVRGTAKKFGISKSTVHKDVTLKNGRNKGQVVPKSIEILSAVEALPITDDLFGPKTIKGVFLSTKNPVVKLGLVIK